jgi:hypothetical protein
MHAHLQRHEAAKLDTEMTAGGKGPCKKGFQELKMSRALSMSDK